MWKIVLAIECKSTAPAASKHVRNVAANAGANVDRAVLKRASCAATIAAKPAWSAARIDAMYA
jgi:hypothetical protein